MYTQLACPNLQENQLKYGFVITILELPNTIPTLWEATQSFMKTNADLIPEKNLMPFVTAPDGSYNLCHFWSNFEIGDLNFFRSKAYQRYFDHLDRLSSVQPPLKNLIDKLETFLEGESMTPSRLGKHLHACWIGKEVSKQTIFWDHLWDLTWGPDT